VTQVVPNMKHRRLAARRRSGFTLIELLIVIGIILFLLAIGIYGYRSLEKSASEKQTRVNLANADSLLKGMNAIGAPARIEGPTTLSPAPVFATGATLDATNYADVNVGQGPRSTAISVCQSVVKVLRQSPDNQKAIQAFPPAMLLPPPSGTDVPVLADAWGNPMIFVPSGGLKNVKVNGTAVTVTSTGSVRNTAIALSVDPASQNHGFWASAGPDGKFAEGDDNIYSFQK
jgi:prepilin-type N-terminal cleavage/methylation domain-containing protein